jgi:hypothetical protein
MKSTFGAYLLDHTIHDLNVIQLLQIGAAKRSREVSLGRWPCVGYMNDSECDDDASPCKKTELVVRQWSNREIKSDDATNLGYSKHTRTGK